MLGMTMSCARCHTHKYDPVTHKEYFSLLAFFNSTAENPLDGNKYDHGPAMKAPAQPKRVGGISVIRRQRSRYHQIIFDNHLDRSRVAKTKGDQNSRTGRIPQPHWRSAHADVPAAMGSFPKDAPRNRLGLAQWLTADTQPLVTRVLINRICKGYLDMAWFGRRKILDSKESKQLTLNYSTGWLWNSAKGVEPKAHPSTLSDKPSLQTKLSIPNGS